MRCIAWLPVLALIACGSDDLGTGVVEGADAGDVPGTLSGGDASSGADSSTLTRDAASDARLTDARSDAAPAVVYAGEGTYYAADGTGACGFPASPNALLVAAMNKAQYKKSLCGQCVHVLGPKGEVTVRIVDLCPGCASGDLDLSEEAFLLVSPLAAGRVKITWSFVPCP